MRILAVGVLVIAVVGLVAQPRTADACACRPRVEACEALTDGVVFVGTAKESTARDSFDELVEFDVTEVFGATLARPVMVMTSPMACGVKFIAGTTYLVYAHVGRGGFLTVSGCSRTAPIDQRADDLAIARAVPTATAKLALVEGTVTFADKGRSVQAGIEVRVQGTTISAKTTKTGAFTFRVPVGRHKLEVVSTELRIAGGGEVAFVVPSPRACPRPQIDVAWAGRITGRLTDRRSRPLAHVIVVAGPRKSLTEYRTATTDADGRYLFEDLAPGRYEVAVSPKRYGGVSEYSPYPTTAYPGDVVVARGGLTADISFQLPDPVPVHSVSGRVFAHDGTPAEGARVNVVWSNDYNQTTQTNGGGGYDMRVLHGKTVRLSACWDAAPGGRKCTKRDVARKITKRTDIDLRLAR